MSFERDTEGEDEGVVELDALDVEFVEEVVGFGGREVIDAGVFEFVDEAVEGAEGDAQGWGGEFEVWRDRTDAGLRRFARRFFPAAVRNLSVTSGASVAMPGREVSMPS